MGQENDQGRGYVEALLKKKSFREGLARGQEKLRLASEQWPHIQVAIEAQRERLAAAGFPAEGD